LETNRALLNKKSQIQLDKINSSGEVFAPAIRYNNGRFYMTTTNNTTSQNFYVWTDNIYDEWSDPIYVDQGGIDPSLYFEDEEINLGIAKTRYLSSEVAGEFTGVIIGLYAHGESCYNYSEFTNFECRYL
jgi:alpha-N-arabinofuranosidase